MGQFDDGIEMKLPSVLQNAMDAFMQDRSRFCEGALFGLALGMATLVVIQDPLGIAAEMVPGIFLLIAMFIVRRAQAS